MNKIRNPYKDSSILELNMMAVHEFRSTRFSTVEAVFTILPILAIALIIGAQFMPELTFFADCKNVPNGDVCSITIG